MTAASLSQAERTKVMTTTKTIVIWGSEDVLSSSIEFFIAAKEDWKVIRVSKNESLNTLFLTIKTAQPDIVIISREFRKDLANIPLQLLKTHPVAKVIMVNLENNLMDVYTKQKILAKEASDLITLIENEP